MPYNRVQDVIVSSSILSRLFGLATVTVQNASGRNMLIPAVAPAVAEELRTTILAKANAASHPLQ